MFKTLHRIDVSLRKWFWSLFSNKINGLQMATASPLLNTVSISHTTPTYSYPYSYPGCTSDCWSGVCRFDPPPPQPPPGWQHSFLIMKYFLQSFSLFLWFTRAVSGKRMCIILVYLLLLDDEACLVKVRLGKLTALNVTPVGWRSHKTSTQTNKPQPYSSYPSLVEFTVD